MKRAIHLSFARFAIDMILQIADQIRSRFQSPPFLIGISGFGGSGKSTLAREIAQQLESVETVSIDEFWLPDCNVLSEDWIVFDRDRLRQQVIIPAHQNQPITYQVFDWEQGKLGNLKQLPDSNYLIIEGISVLHPDLCSSYGFTIWVDCPLELAQARGLNRGKTEYNIDESEIWINCWTPNDRAYFEKYRPDLKADYLYRN